MRWLFLQRIDEALQLGVVYHAKERKIYPLTCFYVFIFSLSICVYIALKERGETKIKHKEVGAVIEGHTHRKKRTNVSSICRPDERRQRPLKRRTYKQFRSFFFFDREPKQTER